MRAIARGHSDEQVVTMIPRLAPHARPVAAVVAACLLATGAQPLLGQPEPRFDWGFGVGAAEVGGRAKADEGGLFARLGAEAWLAGDTGIDFQTGWYLAPNSAGCLDIDPRCSEWVVNGVVSFTLGVVRRFPIAGSVVRPLRLDTGVGVAAVTPNVPGPSPRTVSLRAGAQLDFLSVGGTSFVLDVHAMALPNVHDTSLWVVPLSLGLRF